MKQVYRNYLLRIRPYINLTAICKALGIDQSNVTKFLRGEDSYISEENLEKLCSFIKNVV